jgi:hypothetical protein
MSAREDDPPAWVYWLVLALLFLGLFHALTVPRQDQYDGCHDDVPPVDIPG